MKALLRTHQGCFMASDLKCLSSAMTTRRRTKVFLYGFIFSFIACTTFIAFFVPSNHTNTGTAVPWYNNLFISASASTALYRSEISGFFSHIFSNSSSLPSREPRPGSKNIAPFADINAETKRGVGDQANGGKGRNQTSTQNRVAITNQTGNGVVSEGNIDSTKKGGILNTKKENVTANSPRNNTITPVVNETPTKKDNKKSSTQNQTVITPTNTPTPNELKKNETSYGTSHKGNEIATSKNQTSNGSKVNSPQTKNQASTKGKGIEPEKKRENLINSMIGCDLFQGKWVKDDSYPLYPEGTCPHIDEPFDCYHNGRPDRTYQKLRWQPHGCKIPRLNARDMLERLRGKRLVFVGDSLNRNMWESLVCTLRHAIKDKSKVFEASGREEFRTEGSYSFLFMDYNCSIEFFRSTFLVQEWEMPTNNGTTKETLRIDLVEKSSPKFKNADVLIFNTGHWWTHEKTQSGIDYYQEGNSVHAELNAYDAFHKAMSTWANWIDTNVNPKKTIVLFRGYSASHFSGGQWNSGGACDKETEPIKNEDYLTSPLPIMNALEDVLTKMKTPVGYLNITRMSDYRKDAHPSVYRAQNLTEEEKSERYQDCSHWCLPGVPDSWNELVYAQIFVKQYQLNGKL